MASLVQQLAAGQKVNCKELEHGYQIAILAGEQPGPTVAEVASEYVVLDDAEAGVKTRIPVYLIKSIIPAPGPATNAA